MESRLLNNFAEKRDTYTTLTHDTVFNRTKMKARGKQIIRMYSMLCKSNWKTVLFFLYFTSIKSLNGLTQPK